jgi:DNA-binding CsgD family transcriptional regulator
MRWAAAGASVAVWRDLRASGDRFAVTGATAETTGERLAAAVSALHVVRARTASEGRALALRALGQGELLADVGPESAAFWFAPLALLWADALEEAHDACTDVIETARRHGSLPGFALATQIRAYVSWRSGSLADAEADAASALPHESLPGFPRQYGDAALVNVLLARGRPADAAELIRQQGLDRGSGQGLYYLQARARLHAALERSNEALDDLLACGSVEQELEITTPAFCNWRTDAVPLLASLGRAEEAHRLAEQEVERCRAFGAASPLGASLRTLGEIEGREDGIVLLREAVEVLTGSPARLEHALALLALGEALRRAGRRTDARAPLREALELARGCGADAVSARANDELVLAGARPRRDPTESRSRLTPGELRVARLAAEGMTNREIAQGLFLTENTIETHLRSVFRKLTIGSRSQLARAL